MCPSRKIQPDNHDQWPFLSLRDYLAYLDKNNRVIHIEKAVDAKLEIGAVSRKLFWEGSDSACVFWNTTSSEPGWNVAPPYNVVVEGLHRRMSMFEEIFGVPKEAMYRNWCDKMTNLYDPVVVTQAPCKEVVLKGEDIDLQKLPVELCGPRQGGPFITMGVCFLRHPDTAVENVGVYRLHVKSKDHTGILIVPHQHSASIYAKYGRLGKPMPMAVAIGTDPLLPIVGAAPFPASLSELRGWGALQGQPMEMVECETSDLLVPAQAEYVLEGEVLLDVRDQEGPFGEYTGFYSGIRDLPVFKVKCITHRRNPMFQTVNIGKPPCEANHIVEMGYGLELTRAVREYLPEVTAVRSVSVNGLITAIQIDKQRRYKGIAMRAGNMVWTMKSHVKQVLVIDDDIDIWSNDDILWAFATRCQAHKDVVIIPNVSGLRLDPSEPHGGEEGISCKLIVDCTEPFPPHHAPYMRGVALPDPEMMERVRKNWSEYVGTDLTSSGGSG